MGMDAWLREFEEAMHLVDEITFRIGEQDRLIKSGADTGPHVAATQHKLRRLGTTLDHLDTLLQNPPPNPALDVSELYKRQAMILGTRYKTKQMVASLIAANPLRANPHGHASTINAANTVVVQQDLKIFIDGGSNIDGQPKSLRARLLDDELSVSSDRQGNMNFSMQLACLIFLGGLCAILFIWTVVRIM